MKLDSFITKDYRPDLPGSYFNKEKSPYCWHNSPVEKNKTILVLGTASDCTTLYFVDYLFEKLKNFLFLDLAHVGDRIHISTSGIHIPEEKKILYFDDISGIFNRALGARPKDCGSEESIKADFVFNLVESICETTNILVLNKYSSCLSNSSKPYQMDYMTTQFLVKPKAVIYANTHLPIKNTKHSVVKSVSSHRCLVKKLEAHDCTRYVTNPTLVQQYIPGGENIRVHVVDRKCFAQLIKSTVVDFRYPEDLPNEYTDYILPDEIAQECITVSKQLDLKFCGIDIVKDNNKYYLLEVNPAPGYDGFERRMVKPLISEQLIGMLESGG